MKEARHKRTNTVRFYFYEVPGIGTFIETERIQIPRDLGREKGIGVTD